MPPTEQELDRAIDARIAERQASAYVKRHRLPELVPPAPGTWEATQIEAQERKRQERRAAAKAEEDRLRAEQEAEEQRQREEWERNAPRRAAAVAELATVTAELATVDAKRDELLRRSRELADVASR